MERALFLTGFLVVVVAQNSTVVKRGGVEIFPEFAIVCINVLVSASIRISGCYFRFQILIL